MNSEYTAGIKQDDGWWVGWIEEVPGVNCQEKTIEELRESLKITLKEALEFNRQDALSVACTNQAGQASGHAAVLIRFP